MVRKTYFNRTIGDIIKVSLSNICIVISGIFVGFLIPKIMGVIEYGYYKIFTLYATYVGLLSIGISEGIYLKYSGTKYEDLDLNKIRYFYKFFVAIEVVSSVTLALFALALLKGEYRFIILAISIYLFELNITTYFQYIAQMTMKFNYYSMRNIVKSLLTIVSVGIVTGIYFFRNKENLSYKYYLILVLLVSTILLAMYIWTFRDIALSKSVKKQKYKLELIEIMKLGIPFLVSTMCSTLILSIDRQFVSVYFDTSTYGIYAFAYNMLALVTVCTSAISTVIYPKLKQTDESKVKFIYPSLISYVTCFVAASLCAYFPLCAFVKVFLPQYVNSLIIFRVVFPGLIFSSAISVVIQNYYKLYNKNQLFFLINVIILSLSAIANVIAIYLFRSSEAVSIASIIILVIYYLVAECYFIKKHRIPWLRNFLYCLLTAVSFYIITFWGEGICEFVLYIVVMLLLTCLFYIDIILKIKRIILKLFKREHK